MTHEKTIVSSDEPRSEARRGVLTVTAGVDAGRVIALKTAGATTLGRSDECTVGFDDASLSRVHARVLAIGGEYVFEDNTSTNGSYVNENKITGAVPLRDGDRIRLGNRTTMRFSRMDEHEEAALRQLYEAAMRDGLTGVLNRKALEERLDAELAYASRHGTALSVIMLDVDHFKRVNDTWGHPAGDAVLRSTANLLGKSLRSEDVVGRYGGEEFAVVTRGIGVHDAAALAERIRVTLEATPVPFADGFIRITASAGVASLLCCGERRDKATLIGTADARLYAAKQGGRNRVVGG